MGTLKPLGDTQRIVEWEELPAQVRDIPEDFNPLVDGVLMKHQVEWIGIDADFKVAEKGRRTGITFCEALDDTITAASRKSAGGDNVYYIGDTKEKGLEFIGYAARFAKVMAEAQSAGLSDIEQFLFEDQDEHGDTKYITAYRIRFASGFQIVALSSRPANIRGLQGIVVIDEAAFHADVAGVLEAATALLIWGGKIRVISTHNGKNNPFNQLVIDIGNGEYGADARVYRATFDDAVANGLYERVCLMRGWKPTPDGKKKWYTGIRSKYGPRKAAMREELDAVPRDGTGVCIPGIWIENAMPDRRPVLRLALDDEFGRRGEAERISWCQKWIADTLDPVLAELDEAPHVFGMDYARHRHFSVVIPLAITESLYLRAPFVLELHNVPTRQQEQIVWHLVRSLPRFCGAAIDATGPGSILAEYTIDKFGPELIHAVNLNRPWYGEWMPKMLRGFEDGTFDLPKDRDLDNDLRAVVEIDGIPMVPKIVRRDLKDPDLVRHGDGAIALALAKFASLNRGAPIEFQSLGPRPSLGMPGSRPARSIDYGRGFGVVRGLNDFRGWQ